MRSGERLRNVGRGAVAAGISSFFIYISHFSFLISHLVYTHFSFKKQPSPSHSWAESAVGRAFRPRAGAGEPSFFLHASFTQESADHFSANEHQFRACAHRFRKNAHRFQKNAHRFQKNAHRFRKNAHRFRPTTAVPGALARRAHSHTHQRTAAEGQRATGAAGERR